MVTMLRKIKTMGMNLLHGTSVTITRTHRVRALLAIFALAAYLLPGASAQSITGDLIVAVTDASGAVIPKTALVLTQVSTGQSIALESDANGLATFNSLKPAFSCGSSRSTPNHANFGPANTGLSEETVGGGTRLAPGNFGQITSTGAARIVQVGGRIQF